MLDNAESVLSVFSTWLCGKALGGILRLARHSQGRVNMAGGFAIVSMSEEGVMEIWRETSFNGERDEGKVATM